MIYLKAYEIFELFAGASILWVAVYLISRNPFSKLLWATILYLTSMACVVYSDAILKQTSTLSSYLQWQKATNWAVFFIPVFFLHTSMLVLDTKKKWLKIVLVAGYILSLSVTLIDIFSRYILDPSIFRFVDYKRYDGFAPGVLLIPAMTLLLALSLIGNYLWISNKQVELRKKIFPLMGGIFLSLMHAFGIIGFYVKINLANTILTTSLAVSALVFICSILKYFVLSPREKIFFNRKFYIQSLMMLGIVSVYLVLTNTALPNTDFYTFVLMSLLSVLVMITHTFYDWISTFLNDLLYNISSGLSVVTDEEAWELIKCYNNPQKLEESPLLRLNVVKQKQLKGLLAIDALRELLEESIEHFKPKHDKHIRIKSSLRYQFLRMSAYHNAEEGQILWELGFDDYPVRIMSQAGRLRAPKFSISSPSDYTYTSRNAYLALKKEAIHAIAWRISYMEKHS